MRTVQRITFHLQDMRLKLERYAQLLAMQTETQICTNDLTRLIKLTSRAVVTLDKISRPDIFHICGFTGVIIVVINSKFKLVSNFLYINFI